MEIPGIVCSPLELSQVGSGFSGTDPSSKRDCSKWVSSYSRIPLWLMAPQITPALIFSVSRKADYQEGCLTLLLMDDFNNTSYEVKITSASGNVEVNY